MKTILKISIFSIILLFVCIYYMGCATAEQTTAMLAFKQGDYEKAEREFEKEVKQNPTNEEAWFYLAMSRIQLDKLEAAEQALVEYRRIGKNSFRTELELAWGTKYDEGYKFFMSGRYYDTTHVDTAIQYYNRALRSFKYALVMFPESLIVEKNISAINTKIDNLIIKPIIDKGVELEKEGKYEDAIGEYNIAIAKVGKDNPHYEVIIHNLGLTYLKWGEKLRIENQEKNPDDRSHLEKYKEALPYLEELSKSKDKKTQLTAYELLIQVYGNLNMQQEALEAIKKRDELRAEMDK